jgi:CHASE2 domain-containing sensor protein/serine phosphatase RsbU (regulator of sigma subunit)
LRGLRVLALALAAALAIFILASPPSAAGLREAAFDAMQRMFPLARRSAPALIVAIDEAALARYGQWPWPRTRLAELVAKIDRLHPAAIAFDMFFPEADRYSPAALARSLALPPPVATLLDAFASNDARFAEAIHGRRVVLGIAASDAPDARFPAPPRAAPVVLAPGAASGLDEFRGHLGSIAPLADAAAGRGLMNSGPPDRVVRSVPVVASVQGAIVPSLAIEAIRVASRSGMRLDARDDGLLALRLAGASFPLQRDGAAWLRFSPHDPARFVSAADVLEGRADPARFEGKLVFVGVDGVGLRDYKSTPLGELVPGVEIHAQLAENFFDGVSLVRPDWAAPAEAALLVLAALAIVLAIPRMGALAGLNLAALSVIAIVAIALFAFARLGLLLDPAWPVLGVIGVYGSVVVGSLSEAERHRRLLREQAARFAGEIDAARRIQMGLLPDPREVLARERRVRVAAFLEPARTVGGDFYDCFLLDERRLFVAVADVSGKGLPAALFMAAVKSQLKSEALRGGPVGEVLARTQAAIARENPEHLFVTVFAAVLDLLTGVLEHANAGHEAPFARVPRGVPERFGASGGPPPGVIEGYAYPPALRTLSAGDWMHVVSAGVTEAMNANREFFTAERLRASLTWLGDEAAPEQVVGRVRDDLARFAGGAEAADDITLLAIRWEGG